MAGELGKASGLGEGRGSGAFHGVRAAKGTGGGSAALQK